MDTGALHRVAGGAWIPDRRGNSHCRSIPAGLQITIRIQITRPAAQGSHLVSALDQRRVATITPVIAAIRFWFSVAAVIAGAFCLSVAIGLLLEVI